MFIYFGYRALINNRTLHGALIMNVYHLHNIPNGTISQWLDLIDKCIFFVLLQANIIPPEKLVSPVADAVRKKLATVAWGRKKLGLPVMVRN